LNCYLIPSFSSFSSTFIIPMVFWLVDSFFFFPSFSSSSYFSSSSHKFIPFSTLGRDLLLLHILQKKIEKKMLQTGEFLFSLFTSIFNYHWSIYILSLSQNRIINTFRTSRYWIMVTFRIITYRNDVRHYKKEKKNFKKDFFLF